MSKELFEVDELIFQRGDRSEVAYVIESGQVEIFDGDLEEPKRVALLEAGDIFGEMSLVDELPRSHSARALDNVIARRLSQSDFVSLLREDPEESLKYIRVLFERLRVMNQRVRGQEELRASSQSNEVKAQASLSLRLLADDENARNGLPEGELLVSSFPFKVGRKSRSSLSHNHLSIEDRKPYSISRDHFAFERQGDRLVIRDRGSYLGIKVNGRQIGGDRQEAAMTLEPGENTLVLGESSKAFSFKVVVEA